MSQTKDISLSNFYIEFMGLPYKGCREYLDNNCTEYKFFAKIGLANLAEDQDSRLSIDTRYNLLKSLLLNIVMQNYVSSETGKVMNEMQEII